MSDCTYILPDIETKCDDGSQEFIEQLKGHDWETLKKMLRFCERIENYEWCRLIQNEIDERVKCLTEKK